jgi:hypothetical protein
VKHAWGKYGQPLCDKCKELSLDFSAIWSDLHYIIYEKASEVQYPSFTRDKGRAGMRLADFMQLKEVKEADLKEAQLVALRFYTSESYLAINKALRSSHKPHPLPATVMCINDGLKALRAVDAESKEATTVKIFYRGLNDTQVTKGFKEQGGSEAAPMSTTTDCRVACTYAVRRGETDGALLMKIVTSNNLQRGADLTFLSLFPEEVETLYPCLTFVQYTEGDKEQVIECKHNGKVFKLTVIEVTTTVS